MKKIILILLVFYSLTFADSIDENPGKFNNIWFTFGAGLCSAFENGSSGKPFYSLGLSFCSDNRIIKLKTTDILTSGLFSESLSQLYDFGILYGFKPHFKYINLVCSGGISIVGGYYHIYNTDTFKEDKKGIFSVGFPFELQFDWNAFTKFGVGISIFGDINFEKSFYGAGLNFNFGSLR
ncbi:MAG: hypothetical protein PF574_02915 [Candidatus Delongbacteria bacterium]|nr:hypothetical protein [Candidatus Delongbacteria bacterium]